MDGYGWIYLDLYGWMMDGYIYSEVWVAAAP